MEGLKQKTMRWKTQFNRDQFPTDHETTNKPSLTSPDLNMSIQEILEKHSRGLPLPMATGVPLYDYKDDEDGIDGMVIPNLATMDLAERDEYVAQTQAFIEETKRQAREERAETQARRRNALEQKAKAQAYDELVAKGAHQGPTIQRTTGGTAEQGPKP